MCVLTGFSIMTASFVIYEVQEHHTGSKRLQHISGISETFYWIINFFYDMVQDGILQYTQSGNLSEWCGSICLTQSTPDYFLGHWREKSEKDYFSLEFHKFYYLMKLPFGNVMKYFILNIFIKQHDWQEVCDKLFFSDKKLRKKLPCEYNKYINIIKIILKIRKISKKNT